MIRLFFSLFAFFFISCQAQRNDYDLGQPTEYSDLPKMLNEISGLDAKSDSLLICVQDEQGIIFFFDLGSQQIVKQVQFKKKGDFEGVAYAQGLYYVLESNGTLYAVSESGENTKYEFPIKGIEFEGLCYDQNKQRLILACKEDKGKDKNIKLFSFDLSTNAFAPKPILKLKKKGLHKNFKPSGVAQHPNGHFYIISSVAKAMIHLSPDFQFQAMHAFNPYIFHQPEGICFNSNGDMFVSNEKNEGAPNILKFKYLYAK